MLCLAFPLSRGTASISIESVEMTDIDWIAPNVTQIRIGLTPEFTFLPDGTMELVYLDPEPYSDALLYITNATGEWSNPLTIADPQYGAMNPRILIDSDNITHVSYKADAGGIFHLNNSQGTWQSESMGGGQLSSYVPRMALGPDNVAHFISYWSVSSSSSYNGGVTYVNNTHHEAHETNNTRTRFEQSPDIAVDSTGLVHIVFEGSWNNTALGSTAVRDLYYQTFDPTISEEDNPFSEVIRLSNVQTTSDYVQRPSIYCDAEDNIHIVFIETEPELNDNGIEVHQGYIKYLRLDADPSPSDSQTVNIIQASSSYPSLAIDTEGNVHVVFVGYPQSESTHNYGSDIVYATNRTGTWTNERITNQPYVVGFPRIAINPQTDLPTILYLIKQAYTVDAYMMEYVEYEEGYGFGKHFDMSTSLSSSGEFVSIVEEEAYSYILLTPKQPIRFQFEVSNPTADSLSYNLELQLIENDYVSLHNGTTSQTLATVAAGATTSFAWYFTVSSGQSSEVEVDVLQNDRIIGKIIYMFNIGSAELSIPFGSPTLILLSLCLTAKILYRRSKRRLQV
jgi:hypothetical protein